MGLLLGAAAVFRVAEKGVGDPTSVDPFERIDVPTKAASAETPGRCGLRGSTDVDARYHSMTGCAGGLMTYGDDDDVDDGPAFDYALRSLELLT